MDSDIAPAGAFKLNFLGSPAKQRRAVLEAKTFAPIPLHPAVQAQLDRLGEIGARPPRFEHPISLFVYLVRGVGRLIAGSALWSALGAIVVLASVLVTRELVKDDVSLRLGVVLAATYLVLKILNASVEYFNHLRRLQVHRGVQVSLYGLINAKILRMDPLSQGLLSKGQLKTLAGSDVEAIEDFISAAIQQWTPTLISIAVLTPALYVVSGTTGLIALAVALALLPLATGGAQVVEIFQRRAQREQDSLTTLAGEWVKNIRLVRFLGWQDAVEREVVERMRRFVVAGALRHTVIIVVFAVSFSWSMIPLVTIVWLSSLRTEPLNLIEVFSAFWILDHLMTQIQHIPHSLSLYGSAVAGGKRLIELLDTPDLDRHIQEQKPLDKDIAGQPIAFHLCGVSVSFGNKRAIDDLDLTLNLRERTAIVGSVGSGKSTLLELLIGERHPTLGAILVEHEDTTKTSLWREDCYNHVRKQIAYSPQQPFLSNTSMRLNIDLSGQSPMEDVETAALVSQLKPDLMLFPRGYEEEVGESGINLSGGQRQRVSLARAFISGRSIFVLDDPLSAVDSNTEAALMETIFERVKGLVLVSHRVNELERCDRVIVLDKGRVVEDGDPKVLMHDRSSKFSDFLRAVETHGQ